MRKYAGTLLLLGHFAAGAAAAQTVSATMGAIDGRVTDNTSAVLPGVTVAISGPAMMGTRVATTNDEGVYRFAAVPPGEYTVLFELDGFAPLRRTEIRVSLGFTATLNVQMALGAVSENVTVTGASPVVDTAATKITTVFDAPMLASLPSGSRDYWSILSETPALKLTRVDVGGSSAGSQTNYYAYGTTGQNRPMIEGINSTQGTERFGNYVDVGSFEEIAVNAAAHTAEMAVPGVQMVFISKSGGNAYHGSLVGHYENERWQSFNIDSAQIASGITGGGGLAPRDVNRLHKFRDTGADVGGFVVKDRLWWYGGVRDLETETRVTNFQVKPFATRLTSYTAKVTYTVTTNNKLIGYVVRNSKHQPNRLDAFALGLTGIYSSEDASFNQYLYPRLYKGEWDTVFGDSVFLENRVGQYGFDWPDTNYTSAPRYEDLGNNLVSGAARIRQLDIRRNQWLGSVSYFTNGKLGDHNVKVGWEIFRDTTEQGDPAGSYEDVVHILRQNAPLEVYVLGNPTHSVNGLWTYGTYVTDTWRATRRLSLNLGLRFDRYRNFLPAQVHEAGRFNPVIETFPVVDGLNIWNTFAPRIGATFDLSGNGKTMLKGNYGRYWWNPGAELSAAVNPNPPIWQRRYAWTPDRDVNGDRLWQPGEEGRLISALGGGGTSTIAPGLEDTYTDEVAAWLEREVAANFGVRGGFVWRTERQLYQLMNANQPFSGFNVPVTAPDPGPDGLNGTNDDGAPFGAWNLSSQYLGLPVRNVLANVPDATTNYYTWEITATKRLNRGWSAIASLSHTTSFLQANTIFDTSFRQNQLPVTPNDLINTKPNGQEKSSDVAAKITGSWEGRWGLKVSPVYRFQAGQNFGRTIVASLNYGNVRIPAEPLNARRQDNVSLLDLRIERVTRVRQTRVSPFVDIYNMTNANPVQNTSWSSGSSFLRPLAIVPPRVLRIGARFDW
jgi:Carboxypeptidase regulatory-like domain/TonB dependent receptor